MKSRKCNITTIAVILIFIFASGFYVVANVPLIEGEPQLLEDRDEGRIVAGFYLSFQKDLRKGSVRFNFVVSRMVDGFIISGLPYFLATITVFHASRLTSGKRVNTQSMPRTGRHHQRDREVSR